MKRNIPTVVIIAFAAIYILSSLGGTRKVRA